MKYCVDTWFLLFFADRDPKSNQLFEQVKDGKDRLVIPVTVYAEASKKLLQRGVSQTDLDSFWSAVQSSDKVQLAPADKTIAAEAARVSLSFGLPMLDAFVAATGKAYQCDAILSGDADFVRMAKKKYLKVVSW